MKNTLQKHLQRKSASSLLLAALLVLTLFAGPAAAADPYDPDDAEAGTSGFESIMQNSYDVVLMALKYIGIITLAGGAIVWFTARKNSDRAENGMWLMIGGTGMTVFYFGINAFVSVLKFIAG